MENKKKITLPIKIIIIGFIIGLLFACFGLYKQIDSKRINEERRKAALKQSEEAVKKANKRLEEIEKEYNELKAQYNQKADECDAIEVGSNDWVEKKNKCSREEQELNSKIWKLESEDKLIKSDDYTVIYQLVKPMTYIVFYIIGGSIFVAALLGAFIIYLVKGKKTY